MNVKYPICSTCNQEIKTSYEEIRQTIENLPGVCKVCLQVTDVFQMLEHFDVIEFIGSLENNDLARGQNSDSEKDGATLYRDRQSTE